MAVKVKVTIPNLQRVANKFNSMPVKVAGELARTVRDVAFLGESIMKREVPVDTGNLRARTTARPKSNLSYVVGPTVDYAIYVHEGTKPHTIYPRSKQALYWPGARHPVKRVRHPGTKPNKFLNRTVKQLQPEATAHFKRAIDRILKM